MYDDTATTNCPMCGAINEPLGSLGDRIHYRCGACAWQYSALNENAEPKWLANQNERDDIAEGDRSRAADREADKHPFHRAPSQRRFDR